MLDRIKRGAIAGFMAGVAVAIVVLVHDIFARTPLATPRLLARNLLGAPLESGSSGGGALAWIAGMLVAGWELLAYSVVHFAAFVVFGVLGAWAFHPRRLPGNALTGALFGLVGGSAMFYAGALMAPAFVALPDWRLVAAANAFAGVVLVSQLVDAPDPDADPASGRG